MSERDAQEDADTDSFPDPVEIPIGDEIDLHAFAPAETKYVVQEYCREAALRGIAEVRLVHGKGTGVQRRIVQAELAKHPDVIEYWDAPPERGSWGATIARLRVRSM